MAQCTQLTVEDFCNLANPTKNSLNSENEILSVTPGHIKFPYDNVLAHVIPVKVWNKSKDQVRFRLILPQTDIFQVYCDHYSIFPKAEATIFIKCKPRDTQICIDCFEIQLSHSRQPGIRVLLELLPGVDWFVLPNFVALPVAALDKRVETKIALPVPHGKRLYDFHVISPLTQIFSVSPRCGLIGGPDGVKSLTVAFHAHEYTTLTYKLQIKFPGIESQPYEINVYGRCAPNLENENLREDACQIQQLTTDLVGRQSKTRLKQPRFRLQNAGTGKEQNKLARKTMDDPLAGGDNSTTANTDLFTPAGVMKFLLKKDATTELLGPLGVPLVVSHAMYKKKKEEFEQELKRIKSKQSHLPIQHGIERFGDEAIENHPEIIEKIRMEREKSVMEYHDALGMEPNQSEDMTRLHLKKTNQRQIREAGPIPKPRFGAAERFNEKTYLRQLYMVKRAILNPFIQAARIIITRWRVDQRLKKIRLLVADIKKFRQEEMMEGPKKLQFLSKYQCMRPRGEYPTFADQQETKLMEKIQCQILKFNLDEINSRLRNLHQRLNTHLESMKLAFQKEEQQKKSFAKIELMIHNKDKSDTDGGLDPNPNRFQFQFPVSYSNKSSKNNSFDYPIFKLPDLPSPDPERVLQHMESVNEAVNRLQNKLKNKRIAKVHQAINELFNLEPPFTVRLYGENMFKGTEEEYEIEKAKHENVCLHPKQNRLLPPGVTFKEIEEYARIIHESINSLQFSIHNEIIWKIHRELNREIDRLVGEPLLDGYFTQTFKPLQVQNFIEPFYQACYPLASSSSEIQKTRSAVSLYQNQHKKPNQPKLDREVLKKHLDTINSHINDLQGKIYSTPIDYLQNHFNEEVQKQLGFYQTKSEANFEKDRRVLTSLISRQKYFHSRPSNWKANAQHRHLNLPVGVQPEEVEELLDFVNQKLDLLQNYVMRGDLNVHHQNLNYIVQDILHLSKDTGKDTKAAGAMQDELNIYKTNYDKLEAISRTKAKGIKKKKLKKQKKIIDQSIKDLQGLLRNKSIQKEGRKIRTEINTLLGLSPDTSSESSTTTPSSEAHLSDFSEISDEDHEPYSKSPVSRSRVGSIKSKTLKKHQEKIVKEIQKLYDKYADERILELGDAINVKFDNVFLSIEPNNMPSSTIHEESRSITNMFVSEDRLKKLRNSILKTIGKTEEEMGIDDESAEEPDWNPVKRLVNLLFTSPKNSKSAFWMHKTKYIDNNEFKAYQDEINAQLDSLYDTYISPKILQLQNNINDKINSLLEKVNPISSPEVEQFRHEFAEDIDHILPLITNPQLHEELERMKGRIEKKRFKSMGYDPDYDLDKHRGLQSIQRIPIYDDSGRKMLEEFRKDVNNELNGLKEKNPAVEALQAEIIEEIDKLLETRVPILPDQLQHIRDTAREKIGHLIRIMGEEDEDSVPELVQVRENLGSKLNPFKGGEPLSVEQLKLLKADLTTQFNTISNQHSDPKVEKVWELQNRIQDEIDTLILSDEPVTPELLQTIRDRFRDEIDDIIESSSNPELVIYLEKLKDKAFEVLTTQTDMPTERRVSENYKNRNKLYNFQQTLNSELDDLFAKYDDFTIPKLQDIVNERIDKKLKSNKTLTFEHLEKLRDKIRDDVNNVLQSITNIRLGSDLERLLRKTDQLLPETTVESSTPTRAKLKYKSKAPPMDRKLLKKFQREFTEHLTGLNDRYNEPKLKEFQTNINEEINQILALPEQVIEPEIIQKLRDMVRDQIQLINLGSANKDLKINLAKLIGYVDDSLFTMGSTESTNFFPSGVTEEMVAEKLAAINHNINELQANILNPEIANDQRMINTIVHHLFQDKAKQIQDEIKEKKKSYSSGKSSDSGSKTAGNTSTSSRTSSRSKPANLHLPERNDLKQYRQRINDAINQLNKGIEDEEIAEGQSKIIGQINKFIKAEELDQGQGQSQRPKSGSMPKSTGTSFSASQDPDSSTKEHFDQAEAIIPPEDFEALRDKVTKEMTNLRKANEAGNKKINQNISEVNKTIDDIGALGVVGVNGKDGDGKLDPNLADGTTSKNGDPSAEAEPELQVDKEVLEGKKAKLTSELDRLYTNTNDPRVEQFQKNTLHQIGDVLKSDPTDKVSSKKIQQLQKDVKRGFANIENDLINPQISAEIQTISNGLSDFFGRPQDKKPVYATKEKEPKEGTSGKSPRSKPASKPLPSVSPKTGGASTSTTTTAMATSGLGSNKGKSDDKKTVMNVTKEPENVKNLTKAELKKYLADVNGKFTKLLSEKDDPKLREVKKRINDEINTLLKPSLTKTQEGKLPHDVFMRLRENVSKEVNNIQKNIGNNEVTFGIFNLKKIMNNLFGIGSGIKLPNKLQLNSHLDRIIGELEKFIGVAGKIGDGIIRDAQKIITAEFKRAEATIANVTITVSAELDFGIPAKSIEKVKDTVQTELATFKKQSSNENVRNSIGAMSGALDNIFKKKKSVTIPMPMPVSASSVGGNSNTKKEDYPSTLSAFENQRQLSNQNLSLIEDRLKKEFKNLHKKHKDSNISQAQKRILDEIQKLRSTLGNTAYDLPTQEQMKNLLGKIHTSMKVLKDKILPNDENFHQKLKDITELDDKIPGIFGYTSSNTSEISDNSGYIPDKNELQNYQELVNTHFDKIQEETGDDLNVIIARKRINDEMNKVLLNSEPSLSLSTSLSTSTHSSNEEMKKIIQANLRKTQENVRKEMRELEKKVGLIKPNVKEEIKTFNDALLKVFLISKMDGDFPELAKFHEKIQKEYQRQYDNNGFKEIKDALQRINSGMTKFRTFHAHLKLKSADMGVPKIGRKNKGPIKLPPSISPEEVQTRLSKVNDEINQLQNKVQDKTILENQKLINLSVSALINQTRASDSKPAPGTERRGSKRSNSSRNGSTTSKSRSGSRSRPKSKSKQTTPVSKPDSASQQDSNTKSLPSSQQKQEPELKIVSRVEVVQHQAKINTSINKLQEILKNPEIDNQQQSMNNEFNKLLGKKPTTADLNSASSVWNRLSSKGDESVTSMTAFSKQDVLKLKGEINASINEFLDVLSNKEIEDSLYKINIVISHLIEKSDRERSNKKQSAMKTIEIDSEIRKILGISNTTDSKTTEGESIFSTSDYEVVSNHEARDSSREKGGAGGKGRLTTAEKEMLEEAQNNINVQYEIFLGNYPNVDLLKNQIQLNKIVDDLKNQGQELGSIKSFQPKPLFPAHVQKIQKLTREELLPHKFYIGEGIDALKDKVPKSLENNIRQNALNLLQDAKDDFIQLVDKLILTKSSSSPTSSSSSQKIKNLLEFTPYDPNDPECNNMKIFIPSKLLRKHLDAFNAKLEDILDTETVRQRQDLTASVTTAQKDINTDFNTIFETVISPGVIPLTKAELSKFTDKVNDDLNESPVLISGDDKEVEELSHKKILFNKAMKFFQDQLDLQKTKLHRSRQGSLSNADFPLDSPEALAVTQVMKINKEILDLQENVGNKELGALQLKLNENLREQLGLSPPRAKDFEIIRSGPKKVSLLTSSGIHSNEKEKVSPALFQITQNKITDHYNIIPNEFRNVTVDNLKDKMDQLLAKLRTDAQNNIVNTHLKDINTHMDRLQNLGNRQGKRSEAGEEFASLQKLINYEMKNQLGIELSPEDLQGVPPPDFLQKLLLRRDSNDKTEGDNEKKPDKVRSQINWIGNLNNNQLNSMRYNLGELLNEFRKLPEHMKTEHVKNIEEVISNKLNNVALQLDRVKAGFQMDKINKEINELQLKIKSKELSRLQDALNFEIGPEIIAVPSFAKTGSKIRKYGTNQNNKAFKLTSTTSSTGAEFGSRGPKITTKSFRKHHDKIMEEIEKLPKAVLNKNMEVEKVKDFILKYLTELDKTIVKANSVLPETQLIEDISNLQEKVNHEFKALEMKILAEVNEIDSAGPGPQKPRLSKVNKLNLLQDRMQTQVTKFQARINYETKKLESKVKRLRSLKNKNKHLKEIETIHDGIQDEVNQLVEMVNDIMNPFINKYTRSKLKSKYGKSSGSGMEWKFLVKPSDWKLRNRGKKIFINGKPRFVVSRPGSLSQFPTTKGQFILKKTDSELKWEELAAKPDFFGIRLPTTQSRLISPKQTESVLTKDLRPREDRDKPCEFFLSDDSAEALLTKLKSLKQQELISLFPRI